MKNYMDPLGPDFSPESSAEDQLGFEPSNLLKLFSYVTTNKFH
jgi:hypothetical protein